ncbi:hypothetical protein Trydic_g18739 [Trypoxylus dichotomus]
MPNKETSLNMQISTEQIDSMVTAKEPIRCKLAVNDKPICQCMRCTFLGAEITSSKNGLEVRTYVKPVFTYAAETLAAKIMMRAVDMKTLRTIKGVNLRDQARSKMIREDLEIRDIVWFTRTKRRLRGDRVDRMIEGRWTKWAKDEKPNFRKP